jgi:ABC-type Fe3+ transport system permease subunit
MSSGIVLGLGFLVLYGRESSRHLFAAVLLHAVGALPFAFNSINEGFKALPKNTALAALTLGASPAKQLVTVLLPMSTTRVRSAWAFAALVSLGELNAVMMLDLDWETLPLLIYRAAGSYRYGTACAAGTLLVGLCGLLMFPHNGPASCR